MARYLLSFMVGINVMLIWVVGILLTDYEARLRVVEFKQVGIETAQVHTLIRMEQATEKMVAEVKELLGGTGR